MRKKFKSIGVILLGVSALFLVSCSNTPNNLKTIPEDVNAVLAVDISSITKKGKLDEITELEVFKPLKQELRNEDRSLSSFLDDILDDPDMVGIDYKSDLFIYYINEAPDETFICFTMGIKNEENFNDFVEDMLRKLDAPFDVENEKEYSYVLVDNEFALGWNGDVCVAVSPENYRSNDNLEMALEDLFDLKEKDQITANDAFNSFYKNKKDISFWLSTNLFEDHYMFNEIERTADMNLSDNYVSAFLNFNTDNISLMWQLTPNSDMIEKMEEFDVWDASFNNKLLKLFPEDCFAAVSMAFNPEEYYNLFSNEKDFGMVENMFEDETNLDLKEVFESLEGSVILSLFGFEEIEYSYTGWGYGFDEESADLLDERYEISKAGYLSSEEKDLLNQGKTIQCDEYDGRYCINIQNILDEGGSIESALADDRKINWYDGGWEYGRFVETTKEEMLPLLGMAFDINGNEVIYDLIDEIPENVLTKHGDYYEFAFDRTFPVYLAFNDELFFVTNDMTSLEAFVDDDYFADNLSKSDISSNISGSSFYAFLSLNYDDYPSEIKDAIEEEQSYNEEKMMNVWSDFAKSIEIKRVDNYTMEIVFTLMDSDYNSLDAIISTIDHNFDNFMNF